MSHHFLGFFSGFPSRRFPEAVLRRLDEELTQRSSLVFISAWPEDYARNDEDSAGMYRMFSEERMAFPKRAVIDARMEAAQAQALVREASCIFLMGGHPGQQMQLLRAKGLDAAISTATAAVFGVSAGAINMAKRALDTKESPVPYDGLGLADITVKPHFRPADRQALSALLHISEVLPIYAMEDDSAIFVMDGQASFTGRIHRIDQRSISDLTR